MFTLKIFLKGVTSQKHNPQAEDYVLETRAPQDRALLVVLLCHEAYTDQAVSVSLSTNRRINSLCLLSNMDKETATHSSVLAWRIPGTGESGGLWSMGLQRLRHEQLSTSLTRLLRDSDDMMDINIYAETASCPPLSIPISFLGNNTPNSS